MAAGEAGREVRRWVRIVGGALVGLIVLAGAALVVALFLRAASPTPVRYAGFLLFPFGFLLLLFLLFLLGRLLFWPWRWWGFPGGWRYRADPAEIIRWRYARGEITREQFQQMMRDLEAGRGPGP